MDEFLSAVFADPDGNPFAARMRAAMPVLPDEPTEAQVDAWIELAGLVGDPEFRERVLTGIRDVPKVGEFLSPNLIERLRVLILGKEWQRVDHFPALTVAALNKSVDAASAMAGKSPAR